MNLVMAYALIRDDPAWAEAGKLLDDPARKGRSSAICSALGRIRALSPRNSRRTHCTLTAEWWPSDGWSTTLL